MTEPRRKRISAVVIGLVVLVVIIGASSGYLYYQWSSLNATYQNYVSTHSYTDTQYNSLNSSYNSLSSAYNSYVSSHSYNNTQYNSLNSNYNSLINILESQVSTNSIISSLSSFLSAETNGVCYLGPSDCSKRGCYDGIWEAEVFTVGSKSLSVSGVNLQMYIYGSSSTVTVSIYATSGGVPSGSPLISGTINSSLLPKGVGTWSLIPFTSSYYLNTNTKYAIVIHTQGNSNGGVVIVMNSGQVSGTQVFESTNSGGSWTNYGQYTWLYCLNIIS